MSENDTSKRSKILLEAGTNELEIVEFIIEGRSYGINVAKVQSIITYPDKIIAIPKSHPSIMGMINLRGDILSIINLNKHLGKKDPENRDLSRIIVCNFNKIRVGFAVDEVNQIHRLSWSQIEEPSSLCYTESSVVVSVAKLEEKIILLIDMEKITSDINPECGLQVPTQSEYDNIPIEKSDKTIFIAEDSVFIRTMILEHLKVANYKTVCFSNGQDAWDAISAFKDVDNMPDHINLLISDVEMPKMDGLHLIHNIKSDPKLREIPCLVFSSLVTPELAKKCQSVGADNQISKPEIEHLLGLVNDLVI